jgi:hypothetical protein
MTHDVTGLAQLQILACPDRPSIGFMRSRFGVSGEPRGPTPLTFHEFRDTFTHA